MPPPRRGAHILLIDDDGDSRELYRQVLEWAGFHVQTASNGQAALRAAHVRPPDVVLVDLMMPGMDGGLVLERLRDDERTQRIPVIALTGVPEWLDDHRDSPARFDGVLVKPASSDDLLREIRRVLERAATTR